MEPVSRDGSSSRRDEPDELGRWVVARLDFLRVLVKHYVHMEHRLYVFLRGLFSKYDRYVRDQCGTCFQGARVYGSVSQ